MVQVLAHPGDTMKCGSCGKVCFIFTNMVLSGTPIKAADVTHADGSPVRSGTPVMCMTCFQSDVLIPSPDGEAKAEYKQNWIIERKSGSYIHKPFG